MTIFLSILVILPTFACVLCAQYYVLENDQIPLTYGRFVRENDDSNDTSLPNGTHLVNTAPDNPFEAINIEQSDFSWVNEALKDIAHYLRSHKFNEYDRRYETSEEKAPKYYHLHFPKPPLRSLHWEVHKFCEPSFLTCVEYLNKKVKNAGFRREDDTSVVMLEQEWNVENNTKQVNTVEEECKKLFKIDKERADPFEGPIERYQWRATASYYMCWYTMNGVSNLASLNDSCDNFAGCLNLRFGARNKDPRADEGKEFSCALYSFCPDPCCPLKHTQNFSECWQEKLNPCYSTNTFEHRQCKLQRSKNTDFNDIVMNRWNVSCYCSEPGFEWDAKYGICVDIDECVSEKHQCNEQSEACLNKRGSFTCACKWGYSFDGAKCVKSPALDLILKQNIAKKNDTNEKVAGSVVKRIFKIIKQKITGHVVDEDENAEYVIKANKTA